MKINNTSVPGIYTYMPGIELECGDFVIYNNSDFISLKNQVKSVLEKLINL